MQQLPCRDAPRRHARNRALRGAERYRRTWRYAALSRLCAKLAGMKAPWVALAALVTLACGDDGDGSTSTGGGGATTSASQQSGSSASGATSGSGSTTGSGGGAAATVPR